MLACLANAQTMKIAAGTAITNNGATITLSNTDLLNDGNLLTNSGVFVMTGSSNNIISGTGATTFNSLQFNKTVGAKVLLQKNVVASGAVTFNGGLLDLGNNFLELKFPSGLLQNENETNRIVSSGTGQVFISQSLNAPMAVNPGNLGVTISSTQNLGLTTISRGQKEQVTPTGEQSIKRVYKVEPVNNINLNATLRLNYFDAEINNLNESTLTMWQYKNSWSPIGVSTKSTNQNYAELTGINELTQFTLGNPSINGEFQLSGFTGVCKGSDVRLQWKTANEGHIKQYIVEKSTDGANWQVAATVPANPAMQNAYSVLITPAGAIHFRLKAEWVDGKFTFADPIKVDCNKGKGASGGGKPNGIAVSDMPNRKLDITPDWDNVEFSVSPNPTTGQVRITARLTKATPATIEIRDMNGKLLWSKSWSMQEGSNSEILNLTQYVAGTYLLVLHTDLLKKSVLVIKK
jgi:hypothetical protein